MHTRTSLPLIHSWFRARASSSLTREFRSETLRVSPRTRDTTPHLRVTHHELPRRHERHELNPNRLSTEHSEQLRNAERRNGGVASHKVGELSFPYPVSPTPCSWCDERLRRGCISQVRTHNVKYHVHC